MEQVRGRLGRLTILFQLLESVSSEMLVRCGGWYGGLDLEQIEHPLGPTLSTQVWSIASPTNYPKLLAVIPVSVDAAMLSSIGARFGPNADASENWRVVVQAYRNRALERCGCDRLKSSTKRWQGEVETSQVVD